MASYLVTTLPSDARLGTLKLSPKPGRIGELEADYNSMRPMIFGEAPPLENILESIAELERKINVG